MNGTEEPPWSSELEIHCVLGRLWKDSISGLKQTFKIWISTLMSLLGKLEPKDRDNLPKEVACEWHVWDEWAFGLSRQTAGGIPGREMGMMVYWVIFHFWYCFCFMKNLYSVSGRREECDFQERSLGNEEEEELFNCYHLPVSESYLLIGTPGKKVVAIAPDYWMKSVGCQKVWARMGKQNWNKGWQKEKCSRGICQHRTYSFEAEKTQACSTACCSFFSLCHPRTEHSFI